MKKKIKKQIPDDIFILCVMKKLKLITNTWDELNEMLDYMFYGGHGVRNAVARRMASMSEDEIRGLVERGKGIYSDQRDGEDTDYFEDDNEQHEPKATAENYREHSFNSDGTQTSKIKVEMTEEQSKDPDFVLEAHGFDSKFWRIVKANSKIWDVYSKQDGVQTLYASHIRVTTKDFTLTEDRLEEMLEGLKTEGYQAQKKKKMARKTYGGDLLMLPISDFHYNLQSDTLSTGNEYNNKIAKEVFFDVINDTLRSAHGRNISKVLFVIGNDFINADNLAGTTTRGTPQDNHESWFKVVEDVKYMIRDGIEMLKEIAPVEIIHVNANHDLHTMYSIVHILEAFYEGKGDEDVTFVDISPMERKYYRFGSNLIALSHDIRNPKVNGLKLITTEAQKEWGSCSHAFLYLGHLHTEMAYEKEGLLEIYRLPACSGWSRWTKVSGYVQTEIKNLCFFFKENGGIRDLHNYFKE